MSWCPEYTRGSSWLPSSEYHESSICFLIQNSWNNIYQAENESTKASYQSDGGRLCNPWVEWFFLLKG